MYQGSLYAGRAEAIRQNYKAYDGETIQYVDVMSLYPYICKNFKFPLAQPVIHVGGSFEDKEACLRMDGLKMFYLSARVALSSPAPLPSQSETTVLPVWIVFPNLQYW